MPKAFACELKEGKVATATTGDSSEEATVRDNFSAQFQFLFTGNLRPFVVAHSIVAVAILPPDKSNVAGELSV
jgi:hypothetical protein